ncbi:MAG: branched-chain alpha-keto acid dehydrogenase subunit E2 [Ferrovum sp.]|nr:branched-chain alpha-keto acid dehydrogenase subunit E2 [Ferrovum sp.]NDU87163.1 branched-chain alpha-keto acid dehydrogenase subunit E2 [Ferrovum sp.]
MGTEVRVPDIGDFKNIPVIEILVKEGDVLQADQALITLESDKATLEVPTTMAGKVQRVMLKLGDRVSEGTLILMLETVGQEQEVAVPLERVPEVAPSESPVGGMVEPAAAVVPVVLGTMTSPSLPIPPEVTVLAAEAEAALITAHAGPSVRRFARELGVDLTRVRGSGPKNRILREDVQSFVKAALQSPSAGSELNLLPWPDIDFAKFGPVEARPLGRVRKISGANLHRNWVMIPHVTNHEEADITDLENFRQQLNHEAKADDPKITLLTFLLKALATVLPQFPEVNASLQGDALILKHYINLGFAADTAHGLMVPVVRKVPDKGLRELSREVADLARRAREGKLSPEEMQGGTFSVSSLGGVGGSFFTPIINAPEVAILGAGRALQKPQWYEGAVRGRWMLPLSLSYDHRVIDGATAARFNEALRQVLNDVRRMVL